MENFMREKRNRAASRFLAFALWLLCMCFFTFPVLAEEPETGSEPEPMSPTVSFRISGTSSYDQDYEVLRLTNALRAEGGLEPLQMDRNLMEAATQRAAECAFVFEHIRPDTTMCYTASEKMHGENIAAGYNGLSTAAEAVNGWRNSPGHYANIMTPDFRSIGVGHFTKDRCSYWVQCFSCYEGDSFATSGVRTNKYIVNVISDAARHNLISTSGSTLKKGSTDTIQLFYEDHELGFHSVRLDSDGFAFSSSAPGIVSVDPTGNVKSLSAGTATVTAALLEDPSVKISVQYTVTDPNARKIKLYAKGGKFPDGKTSQSLSVTNGSKYGTLSTPIRKGYTFTGWFDAKGKQVRSSTKVSISKNAVGKLYAKWKKITVGQTAVTQASGKKKKTLKVTFRKVSGISGYQVYVSANKKFKKKGRIIAEVSAKKKTATIRHTLKNKYLYVKVRAYKIDSAGKRVYGKFSAVKQVKMK